MNKTIVNSINDDEFKKIVESSSSILEVSKKLGFKHSPGKGSKDRIKKRINELNISLDTRTKKEREIKESNYANTKEIGFVGEKALEFECAKNKIIYFKTDTDNLPYDYLIQMKDGFKKVQVKTTEFKNDDSKIEFSTRHGNYYTNSHRVYKKDEIDYFYLYCIETGQSFLLKNDGKGSTLVVRLLEPKNNQKDKIKMFYDYEFTKIIRELL